MTRDFRDILFGVQEPFAGVSEPPTRGVLARATLGGKYNYVIRVYQLSVVVGTDLLDLGWQSPGNVLGIEDGPEGYYVWVEPYLIVFGYCQETPHQLSRDLEWIDYTEEQLWRASHSGKYQNLLKALFAPGEREVYGEHLEFGFRDRREYLHYRDLPAGYWVWEWPHWFIFGEDTTQEDTDELPVEEACQPNRLTKASMDGRFQTLKEYFYLPYGFSEHSSFEILGHHTEQLLEGYLIPEGYWVWYAPYLYVFEEDLEKE